MADKERTQSVSESESPAIPAPTAKPAADQASPQAEPPSRVPPRPWEKRTRGQGPGAVGGAGG